MTNYVIICSEDCIRLAEEVERKMAAGWKCNGGVSVSIAAYTYDGREGQTIAHMERYAQAMVR